MDEVLVCFRSSIVSSVDGKVFFDDVIWRKISKRLMLVQRSRAEHNSKLKQLCVYILFKLGERFLVYERGETQKEERLRGKLTLGIGGHVNSSDYLLNKPRVEGDLVFVINAVKREVSEEVKTPSRDALPKLLCFINDDSVPVDCDHFGLVWIVELDTPEIKAVDEGVKIAGFYTLAELRKMRSKFEYWSQFLIDYLTEKS